MKSGHFLNLSYVNSRRHVDSVKSEAQMVFESTTLRDLVGCSNQWATGDSVVSKDQVVGMTGTASLGYTAMYLAHVNSLTASRCHIKASRLDHGGSWVQIHLGLGFFRVYVSPRIYVISCRWCLRLKNQFDESKPEWLAQELGLRRLQRMD